MNINLTLLGQTIGFALFVWFCMRFVWPPLKEAMDKRRAEIAEGLAAAERGQQEQERAEQQAEETLRDARNQASEIIEQANRRGSEIVEEAKESARAEGERIKQAAKAEVEQEVNRARDQLRGEVGRLSVAGAERILGREIDAERHEKMLDDLIAEL